MAARVSAARLLSACVQLAASAGAIVREVQASGALDTRYKGHEDPVTEADLRAQRLIEGTLRWAFPAISVRGEENIVCAEADVCKEVDWELVPESLFSEETRELQAEEVTVWVDPLDGTINFTKGDYIGCTVLIGVAVNGRPLYGAIHHIFHPEQPTYWGGTGLGLFKYTARGVEPLTVAPPPSTFILVSTKYHDSEAMTAFLQSISADQLVRAGGTGSKALKVLLGEVSVYAYPTTRSTNSSKWDICAPQALIAALPNGAVTDINGKLYDFSRDAAALNAEGIIMSRSPAYHLQVQTAYQHFSSIIA